MTVVLATIATIFLLIPGFAFIAGVNITDKNLREIVFRGTPAEIAYVVAVSLVVHWAFTLPHVASVDPSRLVESYMSWYQREPAPTLPPTHDLAAILSLTLRYFLVTAVIGGALGVVLGLVVARWHFRVFIKHRWMVEIIGAWRGNADYARVLTTPEYSMGDKAPARGVSSRAGRERIAARLRRRQP